MVKDLLESRGQALDPCHRVTMFAIGKVTTER